MAVHVSGRARVQCLGHQVVELDGLLCGQLLLVFIHFEQVTRSSSALRAGALGSRLIKGSQDLFNVIIHANLDSATNTAVECHAQILVNLASAHGHLTGANLEDTLVLITEILDHAIHDLGNAMAQFAVVHMEADGHLLALDHFVGDARIVRVEFKPHIRQALHKLSIVEKACHHGSVECVLALHQQLLHSFLVLSYVRTIDVRGNAH